MVEVCCIPSVHESFYEMEHGQRPHPDADVWFGVVGTSFRDLGDIATGVDKDVRVVRRKVKLNQSNILSFTTLSNLVFRMSRASHHSSRAAGRLLSIGLPKFS